MAKVLIVDDEQEICREFQKVLEDENHQVDIAFDGPSALQKVKAQPFDIVFLDVLMPKMEGREVFEEIKKIKEVPVAIMSGYIPPHKEREILSLGAVACLRKPLDLKRVKSLMDSIEGKA